MFLSVQVVADTGRDVYPRRAVSCGTDRKQIAQLVGKTLARLLLVEARIPIPHRLTFGPDRGAALSRASVARPEGSGKNDT